MKTIRGTRTRSWAVSGLVRTLCGLFVRPFSRLLSRWRRCHWLAWTTMLLTALAAAVVVVPGENVTMSRECTTEWKERCKQLYLSTRDSHERSIRDLDAAFAHVTVHVIEHGWPRPFLARALVWKKDSSGRPHRARSTALIRFKSTFRYWGGPSYFDVSWSNYDNWPLSADEWILQPWALAVDVMVAFLIVGLVGGAAEWWIRSRGRVFRYHMRDLFAAVAFLCVLLGVYAYHARTRLVEAQGGTPPLPPGFDSHDGNLTSSQRYFGPVWLRKLAGNAYLLPLFHHVYHVSVRHGEKRLDAYRELSALPYLECVRVRDALPLEAVKELARCRRLKELRLWLDDKARAKAPSANVRLLGVEDLARLERLQLVKLELSGDVFLASHVEQVASFPAARKISLRRISATPEEIDAIRAKHPSVDIVVQPDWR